jgi:hypothetical protein
MHRCKHIPQPRKAKPQAKAMVRASTSPTKEKLFFKISFPSKNLKNAITQSDTKAIGQLVANIIIDKGCKDERIERQPVTRYIKNWADSAKFQVCSSHLTLCGLTVNRSVLPNFSYTHPLAIMQKDEQTKKVYL